jgi:23S rRNA (cytosine1962-C5)-methyltransferase
MKNRVIILKPGKEGPLLRRHPWVFSGAVMRTEGNPVNGDVVEVQDASGKILATGHYQEGSIRVRILHFGKRIIDQLFWDQAIEQCIQRRRSLSLPSPETTIFRLVHGEGDLLPGLIVDVYGSTAVIQCHSAGMHLSRDQISNAMIKMSGGQIRQVYDKSFDTPDGLQSNIYLAGTKVEDDCLEYGLKFRIDHEQGQKTGFFIDQRENRLLLRNYARGENRVKHLLLHGWIFCFCPCRWRSESSFSRQLRIST